MRNRIFSFDLIRILACILVVTVHVSGLFFYQYSVTDPQWTISNIFNCLGIIGVPLFFMLSGALLLNSKKEFSIKRFSLHHTLKILLTFIFTLFIFNFLYFCFDVSEKSFSIFKEEVLIKTLCLDGHNAGHLWFLPSLFCLYLLTPLLRKVVEDEKTCLYALILFFLIGIVWHTVLQFDIKYYRIVSSFYSNIPFELFLGYTGYYCLGYYIVHFGKRPGKLQNFYLVLVAIAGFLFTTIGCQLNALDTGDASSLFNEPFSIGQFLTSSSLFTLIVWNCDEKKEMGKVGLFLSGLTFPIYLFHPIVIQLFNKINFPYFFAPAFIAIPLDVILVFILTALLSCIVFAPKKLFMFRHFLS